MKSAHSNLEFSLALLICGSLHKSKSGTQISYSGALLSLSKNLRISQIRELLNDILIQ